VTQTLVGAALADRTTLRVGGPAARLVTASTATEVCEVVGECDARGEPVLVLGGGSNLLVSDDGFAGTVVRVATRGVTVAAAAETDDAGPVTVTVAAGEDWDGVVARTVSAGLAGLECPLRHSGIHRRDADPERRRVRPGGRADDHPRPRVRPPDPRAHDTRPTECGFAYRHSRFKAEPGRWVVLEVAFALEPSPVAAPIRYAELARVLGVGPQDRPPLAEVREAVLALRRGKGMVLDGADPTPGARARSSPTRCCRPTRCRRVLRGGRSPTAG
jgi:UDP-N-acetylmuramate dehydrogenase